MSNVEEAVALAQQISELKWKLKLLEKGMSLKEFIAYVEGTRVIPSDPLPNSEVQARSLRLRSFWWGTK